MCMSSCVFLIRWDFLICVCVGSFEELNLNMLENNIHKNMCKFCIDDDDDSWELIIINIIIILQHHLHSWADL